MTIVVVSVPRVVDNPDVGGHFWVFLQYVDALQRLGCEVWWMERVDATGGVDVGGTGERISSFLDQARTFGFADRVVLYTEGKGSAERQPGWDLLTTTPQSFDSLRRRADLFLNFDYNIHPSMPTSFARSALVDIDPGLLQFWMHHDQVPMVPHDVYFTTGETVGTSRALFPDCGRRWVQINPGVSLYLWPFAPDPSATMFTTVSSWWGGSGKGEWITDGSNFYDNNKRSSFLEFIDVPLRSRTPIELALCLGPDDREDIERLLTAGWRISHAVEVAGTPTAYRDFVYRSRGEFSCAKPSCMRFQNAWISDRTLCYLASGRPAVVQHTGQSIRLPSGEGLFRFSSLDEAVDALTAIDGNYDRHSRAARELAESTFDARATATSILNEALGSGSRVSPSSADDVGRDEELGFR